VACALAQSLQLTSGRVAVAVKRGVALQAMSLVLFGLAWRGWQIFAVIPVAALASVAEPCLQAMMVRAAAAHTPLHTRCRSCLHADATGVS
jgi:hypothetical protein